MIRIATEMSEQDPRTSSTWRDGIALVAAFVGVIFGVGMLAGLVSAHIDHGGGAMSLTMIAIVAATALATAALGWFILRRFRQMAGGAARMASADPSMPGFGEARAAAKRVRLWSIIFLLTGAGALSGLLWAVVEDFALVDGVSSIPPALGWAVVILFNLLILGGSWLFLRGVDELGIADNLWANTVGLYIYVCLFPSWWALHRIGAATEPHSWAIFTLTLVATMLTYGWRKWVNR